MRFLSNLVTLKSSYIAAAGWRAGRMAIRFKSGLVRFYECPVTVWQELMAAPSAGRYFNANIKHKFVDAGSKGNREKGSFASLPDFSQPFTADFIPGATGPAGNHIEGRQYVKA